MTIKIHPDGEIQVNGRWLRPNSEVSIQGKRGKFRYIGYSKSSAGKVVLNFIGGTSDHELMRSFYPEQIKKIHNKNKRGRYARDS